MSCSNGRKGSTLVEFAFVLLTLLAVVFGAIEMDRMLLTYTAVANAARAGVRYAAVHGYFADGPVNDATKANIQNVARNLTSLAILDPATVTPTVDYPDGTSGIGSAVSVTVSVPYAPFTSFFPLNVTLRSSAKATITF